ncbi:polysaccharide deacetylase family protein [Nonomuraea sp. NPDC050536]|uniref:polysaccharide deacetylase family protein n=1 Tax=Nonomuraea sp. NPDC050536 TaxID=3364366 RepID=UPI0037C848A3
MIDRRHLLASVGLLPLAACASPARPPVTPAVATTPATTPAPAPVSTPARLPGEVVHGLRDRPMVALTFHGAGPYGLAERVLSTVERHHAHVTVMAVGTWLNRSIADRVTGAGHDLGNHTMHHLDISGMSKDRARAEIEDCAARLHELTGSSGAWFRQSAARHATPLIRELARAAGYRTCLSYDVDSSDFLDPGERAIAGNVLRAVRPGSIVSLHLGHPQTLAALPRILDGLHRRHLRPVTVTELLHL